MPRNEYTYESSRGPDDKYRVPKRIKVEKPKRPIGRPRTGRTKVTTSIRDCLLEGMQDHAYRMRIPLNQFIEYIYCYWIDMERNINAEEARENQIKSFRRLGIRLPWDDGR